MSGLPLRWRLKGEAELRLSRQLNRYLGGLSIALVATFVAAAIAIVAGT